MKLEQIEQFLEAAKHHSLSEAAEKLYISQSQLSRSIQDLENFLHGSLFVRGNHGIKLTPMGKDCSVLAENILQQIHLLKSLAGRSSRQNTLTLTIGNTGYFSVNLAVAQLVNSHINDTIQFQIHDYPRGKVGEMVNNGACDLAIYTMYSHYKKKRLQQFQLMDLQYFRISTIDFRVVVGKKNPLYCRTENWVSEDMLTFYPLVTANAYDVANYDGVFDIDKLHRYSRLIYADNTAIKYDIIRNTDAFAFSRFSKIDAKNSNYDSVRFFRLKDCQINCEIGWIKKKDITLSPVAMEFIQVLSNCYVV